MSHEELHPNTRDASSLPHAGASRSVFQLPGLPYSQTALEPYLSSSALSIHHGKHHQSYVDKLNRMVSGTSYATLPLEDLIQRTATMPDKKALFNTASHVWNHAFFWRSMRPGGGGQPAAHLLGMIEKAFGSFEAFKNAFMTTAIALFGSGNVWLVQTEDTVQIVKTLNAETPIAFGQNALLTCDMWEHAYYLDYQDRRKDFAQDFLDHLANWDFATEKVLCLP